MKSTKAPIASAWQKGAALASRRLALALIVAPLLTAFAQAAEPAPAPSFWDPGRKLEKPDLSTIKQIRFLTEDDYPPFDFALPDGTVAGFNVDLARALCEELEVVCTIQRRRFDLIVAALEEGAGDAAVASMAVSDAARKAVDFTAPYYTTPGRFVIRKDSLLPAATPSALADRTIAVAEGGAHEAFLKTFFPKATLATFPTAQQARAALKEGRAHAMFGDAITLAFWLNGQEAGECCRFMDGPFTDPRFFGDGVGIAVRKNNVALRRALDYALARIAQKGVYSELYLKYFPIGPY
ncbi:ABC transporter substrate-binding protein [Methylosinus trichosporium OB3b]|uniref:ABC transporter substrate-binding protein n=1 Tax=Methylosinus trichosporium (strain ATCC 35070 / NCIMB 11131 / UNIQEM 75 / OB3b) TaxID=595536 RepID=A0A2D2D636_METT3|nr:ABC transporter substrate-binding protein [Methylosinus trichosporium OB3b]